MKCMMCEGLVAESKIPHWYSCKVCGIEYSKIAMSAGGAIQGTVEEDSTSPSKHAEQSFLCSMAFMNYINQKNDSGNK
jgi:hypothetical protein